MAGHNRKEGPLVADGRMKDRVKGLLGVAHPDPWPDAAAPLTDPVPAQMVSPEQAMAPGRRLPSRAADSDAERQALQVLMLARRTGDEYVALANRHAESTRAEGRATAERIVREAQHAADQLRSEAEQERAEARTMAAQAIEAAKAHAADLERKADEQYAATIGRMAEERDALQQHIEALRQFDQDYRTQLRAFMQNQLRSLDEAEPAVGDMPMPDGLPARRTEHS